jgi:hypothetical protein
VIEVFEKNTITKNTAMGLVRLNLDDLEIPTKMSGGGDDGGDGGDGGDGADGAAEEEKGGDSEPMVMALDIEKKRFDQVYDKTLKKLQSCKKAKGTITVELQWIETVGVVQGEPNYNEFTKEDEESEEIQGSEDPNLLLIRVVRGDNLRAMDTGLLDSGKSDPFVTLKVGKEKRETKVCKKTLNPVWNEEFEIPCAPDEDGAVPLLEMTVSDKDTLSSQIIGTVTLELEPLHHKEFKIFKEKKLKDKSGASSNAKLGSLTVCCQLIYCSTQAKIDEKKKGSGGGFSIFGKKAEDEAVEGDDMDAGADPNESKEEEEEESPEDKAAREVSQSAGWARASRAALCPAA